jgi:hypothetical protein
MLDAESRLLLEPAPFSINARRIGKIESKGCTL